MPRRRIEEAPELLLEPTGRAFRESPWGSQRTILQVCGSSGDDDEVAGLPAVAGYVEPEFPFFRHQRILSVGPGEVAAGQRCDGIRPGIGWCEEGAAVAVRPGRDRGIRPEG